MMLIFIWTNKSWRNVYKKSVERDDLSDSKKNCKAKTSRHRKEK
jgi:hypothetical protein